MLEYFLLKKITQ